MRIHVERRIRRIKAFHIFDRSIPITLAPIINELWTVCAILTNFQAPLIASNSSTNKAKDFDEVENPIVIADSFMLH